MGGEGREEGEAAAATPLLATINVSENQVCLCLAQSVPERKTIICEDRIWANYLPELCALKCTILHKLTDHNISTFLIQGVFLTGLFD